MTAVTTSIVFGPFMLDRSGARLLREGATVAIAPKTFAVLEFLASRPDTLVSKEALLDGVWGHRFVSDSVLKVTINKLRISLGEDANQPRWVHTVPRRGYRFSGETTLWATEATVPGNLPRSGHPLLGRESDIARVHAALSGHRLLTITGPGGVGKTRLALATAGHAAPADGVWLLRLDALAATDPVSPFLARALGFVDAAGVDAHSLARALRPLRLRLVLDNAEHLAETLAPQLGLWLQEAPDLQVLVTSQRPLHLAGEQVLPLAPLALPDDDSAADALAANPAIALLVQRVRTQLPDWQPGPAEHGDLVEIARGLEGLPLALELAAARIPLLGTAGVRERLVARLHILTRGPADAPGRHRSLRAALTWSVSLLPDSVARLLDQCAVFSGGFTVTAVQAVAARMLPEADETSVLDGLDLLRELALVADAGTPSHPLLPPPGLETATEVPLDWRPAPRLRLFESVALFGRERLAQRGESAAAFAAHQDWLRSLFNDADHRQLDLAEGVWLARLEPEAANLQVGMSRALSSTSTPRDREDTLELFVASVSFSLRSGLRHQALGWLRALEAEVETPGIGELPPLLLARLDLTHTVLSAMGLAPAPEGITAALRAEAVFRQCGERRRLLLLLYLRALLQLRYAGVETARADLQALQALMGPTPTVYERRLPAWAGAMVARELGDLETYRAFWAEMLAESRTRGDRLETWKAAWGLGQALFLQQHLSEAIAVMDEAIDELRLTHRLRSNAPMVGQGALMRLARDASTDTLARVREAVQLLRSDGLVSSSLGDALPWAAWWQGRHGDAMTLQRWADEAAAQRGERRGPVSAQLRESFIARLDGRTLPGESGLDDEAALRLALEPL